MFEGATFTKMGLDLLIVNHSEGVSLKRVNQKYRKCQKLRKN